MSNSDLVRKDDDHNDEDHENRFYNKIILPIQFQNYNGDQYLQFEDVPGKVGDNNDNWITLHSYVHKSDNLPVEKTKFIFKFNRRDFDGLKNTSNKSEFIFDAPEGLDILRFSFDSSDDTDYIFKVEAIIQEAPGQRHVDPDITHPDDPDG